MTHRRWTLMVVPHGGAPTKGLSVSERTIRRAASIAAGVGLLAVAIIGILIANLWTSRTRGGGAAALSTAQAPLVRALHARLDSLRDTLNAIAKRDEQIRLLAGLPPDSATEPTIAGNGIASASTEGRSWTEPSSRLGRLLLGAEPDIDRLIHRANTLAASFAEVSDSLERHVDRYARIPSIMPTAGWLSSHFTRRRFHPILHIARPHEGIDVSAPMGAPIVAPAAGTVTSVGRERGYGLVLEIDHGYGIVTKYAHCSRITAKKGQRVQRGQVVAAVGNSGLSTGPHLHYEIHVNGKVVDPLTYVLPEGVITD